MDWSNVQKDQFISSSWDGNVKLWTPDRPRSLLTLKAHQSCVYQALFSPHHPSIIATCSTDGTIRLFDLRNPSYASSTPGYASAGAPGSNNFTNPLSASVLTIPASGSEILTIDWNKYRPWTLASAGVDKMVKVWDCRMAAADPHPNPHPNDASTGGGKVGGVCENHLPGHEYAVRKVQWSPHSADVLASASYDMTCRVWNTSPAAGRMQLMHIHDPHTEFVVGCGWSIYEEGVLASCSWDSKLNVFRI